MDQDKPDILPPTEVSPAALSSETLQAVLESFVLREGTDYGANELSLEQKIKNLKNKVDRGDIILVFDPNSESLTFLTKTEWSKIKNKS